MAQEVTLKDLEAKQKALIDAAQKLNEMKDGEKIAQEAKKLQKQGEELEVMAKAFEQQQLAKQDALRDKYGVTGTPPRTIKVQLTDDQRKQVLEETGVRIEVVELEDGTEVEERFMPEERPEYVMRLARKKAERSKADREGKQAAQDEAKAALAALEKDAPADVQRMLAEKKKDPDFLAKLGLEPE